MQREIKFRGVHECNKTVCMNKGQWVFGYLFIPLGNSLAGSNVTPNVPRIVDAQTGFAWEVVPESVGQFTGLKDVKGAEIWEGDFVEFHEGDLKNFYLVQFKFGAFYLSHHEDPEFDEFMTFGMDWSKGARSDQLLSRAVIGNIHEHPHLLETKEPT